MPRRGRSVFVARIDNLERETGIYAKRTDDCRTDDCRTAAAQQPETCFRDREKEGSETGQQIEAKDKIGGPSVTATVGDRLANDE